jgi:hypothetical protein
MPDTALDECLYAMYITYRIYVPCEGGTDMVTTKKRTRSALQGPQRLRKANGRYVVTIPDEEVASQGVEEGDLVFVTVRAADVHPRLSPRLEDLLDKSLEENADVYRHLAGR